MNAAYIAVDSQRFRAGELTRGPWHPDHQHAGPPCALVCRAIERKAAEAGLGHLGRLTANLLRPVTLGELQVEVTTEYVGRSAGHYAARLLADGKEVGRFTALMQRSDELPVPASTTGHPLPQAPRTPADSEPRSMPFKRPDRVGYADLVENRVASGRLFDGPSAVWFRLRHPLVAGEQPSPYQRIAVAADSGNGISAVLPFEDWLFLNCDLTINLIRAPLGEWICLDARTLLGGNGCGLAESALYDETGLVGRATQSLAIKRRA